MRNQLPEQVIDIFLYYGGKKIYPELFFGWYASFTSLVTGRYARKYALQPGGFMIPMDLMGYILACMLDCGLPMPWQTSFIEDVFRNYFTKSAQKVFDLNRLLERAERGVYSEQDVLYQYNFFYQDFCKFFNAQNPDLVLRELKPDQMSILFPDSYPGNRAAREREIKDNPWRVAFREKQSLENERIAQIFGVPADKINVSSPGIYTLGEADPEIRKFFEDNFPKEESPALEIIQTILETPDPPAPAPSPYGTPVDENPTLRSKKPANLLPVQENNFSYRKRKKL